MLANGKILARLFLSAAFAGAAALFAVAEEPCRILGDAA